MKVTYSATSEEVRVDVDSRDHVAAAHEAENPLTTEMKSEIEKYIRLGQKPASIRLKLIVIVYLKYNQHSSIFRKMLVKLPFQP